MGRVSIGSIVSAVRALPAPAQNDLDLPAIRGLTNLVEELGIDDFIDKAPKERPYAPTMEHGLGLCFRRKVYEPNDPYIADHGVRRCATDEARAAKPDSALLWRESIGVVDVGSGAAGAIPVAAFDGGYVAGYFGFYASAMLRYRSLFLETDGQADKPCLPTNAEKAIKLSAGHEVEIVGQGKLNTAAGIMVGAGIAIGPLAVGVAAVAPITHEKVGEFSCTITGIDGKGKVRVVLRRLKSDQTSAAVATMAGLISPGFDGPDLMNDSALIFLTGNTATVKSTSLFLDYTSAGTSLTASMLNKSTIISAFDFDLNQPAAAQAYDAMLKLSPQKAYDLCKDKNSGVEILTVREKQSDGITSAAFNFFGEKLLLLESIDSDRRGTITRRDGSELYYREKIYEKRSNNFVRRKGNIVWESAAVEDREKKKTHCYYHLTFDGSDFDFVTPAFNDFFAFARALGIDPDRFETESGKTREEIEKMFIRSAKVDAKVDIFFTKEGVAQIEKCNAHNAFSAYLKAAEQISPRFKGFPLHADGSAGEEIEQLVKDYIFFRRPQNLFGIVDFMQTKHIRERYKELTGRRIEKDICFFKEALAFGNEVQRLRDASKHEQAEHFFSRLGKKQGFKFMTTMVALQNLSGSQNMLVRELALSARGMRLAYDSEYTLKTPHDIIYDELTFRGTIAA